MISFCIAVSLLTGCALAQEPQTVTLVLANVESRMATQFLRFAKLTGVGGTARDRSFTTVLELACTPHQLAVLRQGFLSHTSVDIASGDEGKTLLRRSEAVRELPWRNVTVSQLLLRLDEKGLLWAAIMGSVRVGLLSKDDVLLTTSYRLMPWIASDLRMSVSVEGVVEVKRENKVFKVRILSPLG
jgi:hypothetical protein